MEDPHGKEKPQNQPETGKKNTSRRKFMKSLGLLGAGAVTGIAALESAHFFEKAKTKGGKKQILLTQDNKLVEVDSLEIKALEKSPGEQLQDAGRAGIPGRRWVLVVDLAKCRNARR